MLQAIFLFILGFVVIAGPSIAVSQMPQKSSKKVSQGVASGVLEGDVYLVMQNGDIKKIAANTVVEIRSDHATDMLRRSCDVVLSNEKVEMVKQLASTQASILSMDGIMGTAKGDSLRLLFQQLRARVANADTVAQRAYVSALNDWSVGQSPTGMAAHYRFEKVRAGSHILVATTTIGDTPHFWLISTTVGRDTHVAVDLDNSALVTKVRCEKEGFVEKPTSSSAAEDVKP